MHSLKVTLVHTVDTLDMRRFDPRKAGALAAFLVVPQVVLAAMVNVYFLALLVFFWLAGIAIVSGVIQWIRHRKTTTHLEISLQGIAIDGLLFDQPREAAVRDGCVIVVGADGTARILTDPLKAEERQQLQNSLDAAIRNTSRWQGRAPSEIEALVREPR